MKKISLKELCDKLSISLATGKNWVKLGKLVPDMSEGSRVYFSEGYARRVKEEIESGKSGALRSRRNKKYVSGNSLYSSYVSASSKAVPVLQKLLGLLEDVVSGEALELILADCAVHLFADRNKCDFACKRGLLASFLKGGISFGGYDEYIWELISDKESALRFIADNEILFDLGFTYEHKEDILGLIYISCKNIGKRKATGAYYTPNFIVRKLVDSLSIQSGSTILDPCCGTGNFLLQLPDDIDAECVFGADLDEMSVKLARINMALRYEGADAGLIKQHIVCRDYLVGGAAAGYDYIIGNPPWGYDFTADEKKRLKTIYKTARGTAVESYDVFVEKAIGDLTDKGELSFVLPKALLGVKNHRAIRSIIHDATRITYLEDLGDVFHKVQCPCMILGLKRSYKAFSTKGILVNDGVRSYEICTDREITSEGFSLFITDEEYRVLQKLYGGNKKFLKGNAVFALGIVTGNNKEYISEVSNDRNEMVLKGSDIEKFHINDSGNFIVFEPDKFQQVAPEQLYRAKEKLFYRFISDRLVFAYDNRKILSLNSCNIVIPRIEGMDIKYILAILNSRVADFIYKKKFDSVKVLRSHIEAIPIPVADEESIRQVIAYADRLIEGVSESEKERLCAELDKLIYGLYGLDEEEIRLITE